MHNSTFVASTVYNLYLIILYILKENDFEIAKQNHLLIIVENTKNIEDLFPVLEESLFFRKVILLPNKKKQKKIINKFSYTFCRKRLVHILENKIPQLKVEEKFMRSSDIYLCDTDSAKNYFYFKFRKSKTFTMIEDGFATYVQAPSKVNIFKKQILKTGFTKNGHGKEVYRVIATKPNLLPLKLQKKAAALDITNISTCLTRSNKQEIYNAFNFKFSKLEGGKPKVLVLSSPYYQDNCIKSLEDQIFIFTDIIKSIDRNKFAIFFKPHPRDTTNYNLENKVTYIPKLFPVELFLLDNTVYFERGYAVVSSALATLGDAIGEKIYYFEKYKYLFIRNREEFQKMIDKFK